MPFRMLFRKKLSPVVLSGNNFTSFCKRVKLYFWPFYYKLYKKDLKLLWFYTIITLDILSTPPF